MHEQLGKTIFITGGTSGIGKEFVKVYIEHGVKVIFTCRSIDQGKNIIEEIRVKHPNADIQALELDLSNFNSVIKCAKSLIAKEVNLDLVILNAGIHIPNKMIKTIDNVEIHY